MNKRHCDLCDTVPAAQVLVPVRTQPDPADGKRETVHEAIDLCIDHLRERLQRTLHQDLTIEQSKEWWGQIRQLKRHV
jgi:hypothetical protein